MLEAPSANQVAHASVQVELSEATPKRVVDAIAETKKAIVFLEANRGAAPTPVTTDPMVERLKEAKLIHSDIGSFYQFKYDFSDTKRKQTVYMRKEIYTYNSLKVQELFSLCYDKPDPPSAELLQSAFQKRFTIGGLVLEAPSEKQPNWRIRFRASLTTDALPQTLKEYVLVVAGTADRSRERIQPHSGGQTLMFLPTTLPALVAPVLAAPPAVSQTENDAAKARLKSAVEAMGLKYEASPSGLSYSVLFDHAGNRQQKVYIATAPGKAGSLLTHTIYTTVWVNATTPPDSALMQKVFILSKKLGQFYLFKDTKGTWAIRFSVHFDATGLKDTSEKGDTLSTTLKDLTYFVNAVGEETDKQLNGDKDNR